MSETRSPDPSGSTACFRITTSAGATVLAAAGELDLTVTGRLAALLHRELGLGPAAMVFDATAVTFCSARTVTILVTTAADAKAAGIPFAIVTRSSAVLRPLTALGLERELPVHGDLGQALAWLELLPQLAEPVTES
ncbi:STAS domain-containing protein [Amycolatopsis sp. WQ 127309]|uniref:STAS domain-containing protein n=1 Tax=Amycolatopsis sp. WQ 127309 TaxID=2932773 RepID=UPI001FF6F585|nr:STAS domain-containing protein [Amycolatopsis sp. WQ 127309]UOZ03639.1 STAS domain-containing protein [Amycolatopsis sp. WQ 127309]